MLLKEELIVFQTYTDKEQAQRAAATLENNGIAVAVEENLAQLDSNFIGQQFQNPYSLKIPGSAFTRAAAILEDHTVIDLKDVDPGYMLLSFTDDELIAVMKDKQEWGIYNYKLAETLLAQRGVRVDMTAVSQAQAEKQKELAIPAKYDVYWIVIGYAMAASLGLLSPMIPVLYSFACLFSLVVGIHLFSGRKTLSDGTRVHTYDRGSRIHGVLIVILTVVMVGIRITLFNN